MIDNITYTLDMLNSMIFNPMDDNEEEEYDDLDPDKNFYNPIINNITQGCKYYSIPNLNSEISKKNQPQLSLMSMNIRSLLF